MSPQEALDNLMFAIQSSGDPKLAPEGTKQSSNSITQRLTDHTQYTGTHKQRFDEEGKGKGKVGRVQGDIGVLSFEQVTNRKEGNVRGIQK